MQDDNINIVIPEQPEEPEETGNPTVMEMTKDMAARLMRISKKTKMSETGILQVFSFVFTQNEQAKMREQQQSPFQGQEAIDAIAAEQAEKMETREADEVITADE